MPIWLLGHYLFYWYRFVDDTWVIQKQSSKQEFLEHINKVDPAIKFTVEGTQGNGAIPFLDTLITPQALQYTKNPLILTSTCNGTVITAYLPSSVIGTLTHRAKTVCTNPELLQKELEHLREAMGKCKYPTWGITKVQNKVLNNNWGEHDNANNNQVQSTNNQDASSTNTTRSNQNYIGQSSHPIHKRNIWRLQKYMW